LVLKGLEKRSRLRTNKTETGPEHKQADRICSDRKIVAEKAGKICQLAYYFAGSAQFHLRQQHLAKWPNSQNQRF